MHKKIFFWKNHIEQSTYIAYNKATVSETSNRIIFPAALSSTKAYFIFLRIKTHFIFSHLNLPGRENVVWHNAMFIKERRNRRV